jgi:carboxyl-terminal processing protease
MAGDIILKVNGESINGLRIEEVTEKIAGIPLGEQVKMTVKHATGEEAELAMTREEIIVPTVKGFERKADGTWDFYVCDNPKIAYLRITQFTPDTAEKLREPITKLLSDGMQGLILDLRFNPGGRLDQAIQVVDMFIEKGVIVSTRGRARPEQVVSATGQGTLPNFPMIVLVNEHSASASEIVAGSLMDNKRALVIGTRSYGKGSVQEVIPLDSKGGELKLTVAYYYLPSGRLVHKKKDATDWGVQPQIVVPMDEATQARVMRDRYQAELFKRPVAKTTTRQSTTRAVATTQPVDVQLQRAVDTMIALVVLGNHNLESPLPATTAPTTMTAINVSAPPTTQPAEK